MGVVWQVVLQSMVEEWTQQQTQLTLAAISYPLTALNFFRRDLCPCLPRPLAIFCELIDAHLRVVKLRLDDHKARKLVPLHHAIPVDVNLEQQQNESACIYMHKIRQESKIIAGYLVYLAQVHVYYDQAHGHRCFLVSLYGVVILHLFE